MVGRSTLVVRYSIKLFTKYERRSTNDDRWGYSSASAKGTGTMPISGPIAQLAEHRADNAGVTGASPVRPTILLRSKLFSFELRRN